MIVVLRPKTNALSDHMKATQQGNFKILINLRFQEIIIVINNYLENSQKYRTH